jgi:hypothetical protein
MSENTCRALLTGVTACECDVQAIYACMFVYGNYLGYTQSLIAAEEQRRALWRGIGISLAIGFCCVCVRVCVCA